MGSQVTLPLWAVIIVALLAAWAAIDRILVPSVRWAMRRRANRAIDELNERLKLRIQPFKLAKRQALIDQLIFDPEVLRAIEHYAAQSKVTREAGPMKHGTTVIAFVEDPDGYKIEFIQRGTRQIVA